MKNSAAISVSIIIPVFNDQDGLTRCLKFIENQTYPVGLIDVVIVDNGSVPPIVIDGYYGFETKLVSCSKPGSYAARNVGAEAASGHVFAFTDADCWAEKDWIKFGVAALELHKGKSFVGGEVHIVKTSCLSAVALYQHATGFGQEANIKEKKFTGTLNLFCSRDLFSSVGEFEERLLSGGDREWSWRALKKGFSLVYEPKSIIYTDPRTTLLGAIRQARRITAGRKMLYELGLAHLGSQNIAKKRTAWQSVMWILSRKELSVVDRIRVLYVALIIRLAEMIEHIRLACGSKAERR